MGQETANRFSQLAKNKKKNQTDGYVLLGSMLLVDGWTGCDDLVVEYLNFLYKQFSVTTLGIHTTPEDD